MGLFDDDVPDLNAPSVPKETREQIGSFVDDSLSRDEAVLSQEQTERTRPAQGFLGTAADQSQVKAKFGSQRSDDNDYLSKAIEQKQQRKYAQNQRHLSTEIKSINQERYFGRLKQAANLVGQEHQLNEQVRMMRYQAKKAKEAARASVLGSLIGVGGAILGAFAGGPGGAIAGGQAGKVMGENL